ncbi:unnamed protein product [Rotaria sp. Silwood1]|nr:unnamed protein product [Rotaria sp. Silwood1]
MKARQKWGLLILNSKGYQNFLTSNLGNFQKFYTFFAVVNSCTEKFWSAVDCEPRDLIGLRHFSRIMAWFPYGSCGFAFDDENKINERTINVIQEWILKKDRRPHDFANAYLFEWFADVIDKQETQDKAKRHESITKLEEFQTILQNYSSYAKLNRQTTLCDQAVWPLRIASSALVNINDETLKLILQLSQQSALFYRDFNLPIIPFLELYGKSVGFNEETLRSLIVSIALSSSCIVMASPEQTTSIRVHENETFVNIELGQHRRLALMLEFYEIRRNYGYSTSFC